MKPAYKPVLCVVSSHPIKGASGVPTGFFPAELTHPLKVLEDAGIKTTIASIRGGSHRWMDLTSATLLTHGTGTKPIFSSARQQHLRYPS